MDEINKRCGALILDESGQWALLVFEKSFPVECRRIGVPKGKYKITEKNQHWMCTKREVYEEVGINLDDLALQSEKDKVVVWRSKPHSLPKGEKFFIVQIMKPKEDIPIKICDQEIMDAQWYNIRVIREGVRLDEKHINQKRKCGLMYNKFTRDLIKRWMLMNKKMPNIPVVPQPQMDKPKFLLVREQLIPPSNLFEVNYKFLHNEDYRESFQIRKIDLTKQGFNKTLWEQYNKQNKRNKLNKWNKLNKQNIENENGDDKTVNIKSLEFYLFSLKRICNRDCILVRLKNNKCLLPKIDLKTFDLNQLDKSISLNEIKRYKSKSKSKSKSERKSKNENYTNYKNYKNKIKNRYVRIDNKVYLIKPSIKHYQGDNNLIWLDKKIVTKIITDDNFKFF